MTDVVLRESTFALYAAKHYDNPHCEGTEEFEEDLKRFKYVKRLLNSYCNGGSLRERLILNHIIVIYNVFDSSAATKMLFLKMRGMEKFLKPFLVFIGHMPEVVTIGEDRIVDTDVEMDLEIVRALREVYDNGCRSHVRAPV